MLTSIPQSLTALVGWEETVSFGFVMVLVKGLHWEGKSWDMVASLSCLHLCFLLNHVCAILGTCMKQASHGCSACVVAAGLSR